MNCTTNLLSSTPLQAFQVAAVRLFDLGADVGVKLGDDTGPDGPDGPGVDVGVEVGEDTSSDSPGAGSGRVSVS